MYLPPVDYFKQGIAYNYTSCTIADIDYTEMAPKKDKPVLGNWGEISPSSLFGSFNKSLDSRFDKYLHLANRFISETYNKNETLTNIETPNLVSVGLSVINHFIYLGIQNIYFESTYEKSLLFVGDFSEYKIYLEVFFNEETPNLEQIEDSVLNIYKAEKNVSCKAGEVYEVLENLEKNIIDFKGELDLYRYIDGSRYLSDIFNPTMELQVSFI